MISLDKIIFNLLLHHDCVIIPSFGGFVSQNEKASINYDKGEITPPRKLIIFNNKLLKSDGLLINHFAEQNNLSYQQSFDEIRNQINSWKNQLDSGNRIELNKIGTLHIDKSNNIRFNQDEFSNLLISSYGLSTFIFNKPEIESEITSNTKEVILKPQKNTKYERPSRNIKKEKSASLWKYAAAACLLPLIFYSFWLPTQTNFLESGIISIQDLNPFHKVEETKYQKRKYQNVFNILETELSIENQIKSLNSDLNYFSYKYDDEKYIIVKIKEDSPETKNITEKTSKNKKAQEKKKRRRERYQSKYPKMPRGTKSTIVGCFGKYKNATRLVKKLKSKGFNASIIDVKRKLYRVSIGETTNNNDLQDLIQKTTNLGYDSWVLKH
tara:strand:+ start:56 stop:1204 length:1149 start_codon:yes stop_codon:yes gene_type:complete